jgi:hypothetical protein
MLRRDKMILIGKGMLLTSDRRVLSTFHMSGHAVAVCQTSYAAPVWAMEMKVEGYVTVDVGDGVAAHVEGRKNAPVRC